MPRVQGCTGAAVSEQAMDGLVQTFYKEPRRQAVGGKLIYNPINHGGIYSYRHSRLGPP